MKRALIAVAATAALGVGALGGTALAAGSGPFACHGGTGQSHAGHN